MKSYRFSGYFHHKSSRNQDMRNHSNRGSDIMLQTSGGNVRHLFLATLCFFTILWLTVFTQYHQSTQNKGLVIEQTINGKYIVRISGTWDNLDLIESLIKNNDHMNDGFLDSDSDNTSQRIGNFRNVTYTGKDTMLLHVDYTTKAALADPVDNTSIRNVSKALLSHAYYSCPTTFRVQNITNYHLCGDILATKYKLIFFTTMYYTTSSLPFFYNTLRVISSLQHIHQIKPVLFIENPHSFIKANKTDFLQFACNLGWTVLLAPHCNKFGFPVFKSMFNTTMTLWDAEWYGYSNGDMLFDETLLSTIDFVQSHSDVLKVPMLLGRRYNVALEPGTEITHYSELKTLYYTSKIDFASAVDYFIVRKDSFPWNRVGDFVVGRPVYDTWMVWFSKKAKLPIVDTTATVRAIHQNEKGLTYKQNTHALRRVKDGMNYNKNLARAIGKNDASMKLTLGLGYISCIPLRLIKMKRSDINKMVSEGETKIVGRGKTHYPAPKDEEEIFKAIQNLNITIGNNRNTSSDKINLTSDFQSDYMCTQNVLSNEIREEKDLETTHSAEVKSNVSHVPEQKLPTVSNPYETSMTDSVSRRLLGTKQKTKQKFKSKPKGNAKKESNNEVNLIKHSNEEATKGVKKSTKTLTKNESLVSTKSMSRLSAKSDKAKKAQTENKLNLAKNVLQPEAKKESDTKKKSKVNKNKKKRNAKQNAKLATIQTPLASDSAYLDNSDTRFLNNSGLLGACPGLNSSSIKCLELKAINRTDITTSRHIMDNNKTSTTRQPDNFEEPKMIPFIGETDDYVFVLVRRTGYLKKRKSKPGFDKVPFKYSCHKHSNIDMELSELVTF